MAHMDGGLQVIKEHCRMVPVNGAAGRDDVKLDCEVLNGLIKIAQQNFPAMAAEDVFAKVRRNVKPVCVMKWDLMRLEVSSRGGTSVQAVAR